VRGFSAFVEKEPRDACPLLPIVAGPHAPMSHAALPTGQGAGQVAPVMRRGDPEGPQAAEMVRTHHARGPRPEIVQATFFTPVSPILALDSDFPVRRSASVVNGYGSWHDAVSVDEDGRRSV
jgi:hypothetical protein